MTRLEIKEEHSGLPIMPKEEGNKQKRPAQSAPELEEILIQAVHKRRPLWDPTVHFYRNNSVVKVLWEEVAQETGLTDSQSRTKWKSLRDYYRNELKKIKKSDSEGKKPNWVFFQPLSFLEGVIGFTKTDSEDTDNNDIGKCSPNYEELSSNLNSGCTQKLACEQNQPKDEENCLDEKVMWVHSPQYLDHDYSQQPRIQHTDYTSNQSGEPSDLPCPHHSGGSHEPSYRGSNSLKMRPNFEVINKKVLSHFEARRIELLERAVKQAEDEDILFFRSLLPSVKSLPTHRKMRLRLNIQELVCKEIENLRNE